MLFGKCKTLCRRGFCEGQVAVFWRQHGKQHTCAFLGVGRLPYTHWLETRCWLDRTPKRSNLAIAMEPKFTAVQIAKPESINFVLGYKL